VLAIVEHQHQPAIPERSDQARNRIIGVNVEAEHLRDGTGDQSCVGERRQIDEPDPMFISVDRGLGHGEGDRGLADTPGPDNAQQPVPLQPRHDPADGIGASDQPGELLRQIMILSRRRGRQWCGCRRLCDTDRGDKAITLTRRRRDVPPAAASIAQRPPQGAYLEFEISLLDKGASPDAGHQLVFADQLPGALHQSGQDIKRAAAQTHRVIVFEQKSLCRNQAEGAERDRAFGRDEIAHLNLAPSDGFAFADSTDRHAASVDHRHRTDTVFDEKRRYRSHGRIGRYRHDVAGHDIARNHLDLPGVVPSGA